MAYRLLRHIGKIEQSDDNAALLDLLLTNGSASVGTIWLKLRKVSGYDNIT